MSEIVVTSNQPAAKVTPAAPAAAEKVVDTKETLPAAAETPAETVDASGASNETEVEQEAGGEEEKAPDPAQAKKKKNGYKDRIKKVTKRATEAEQRVAYLQGLLEGKKTSDGGKTSAESPNPDLNAEPKLDTFDSHEEYLKALTKFHIAEASKAAKVSSAKESEYSQQLSAYRGTIDTAKTTHKDFEEIMDSIEDVDLSKAEGLKAALFTHENAGELMYQLGKDRAEYEKIVALPSHQQARALGRFEAKLEAKTQASPAKQASNAPAPLTPVGNKGTGAGKKKITDPNLSQREYEALRSEQMKSRGSSW